MKQNHKNCPECEGNLARKKVDFSMYGESLGEFPALVCSKCGSEYFDDETTGKIEKIAKQKGLWGLESQTKIAEVGNSYAIRISKRIFDFMDLKKGEEVTIKPESKKKLVISV